MYLRIYIPIWLDLLYLYIIKLELVGNYLHSNMVRFIIPVDAPPVASAARFTFQYG